MFKLLKIKIFLEIDKISQYLLTYKINFSNFCSNKWNTYFQKMTKNTNLCYPNIHDVIFPENTNLCYPNIHDVGQLQNHHPRDRTQQESLAVFQNPQKHHYLNHENKFLTFIFHIPLILLNITITKVLSYIRVSFGKTYHPLHLRRSQSAPLKETSR